MTRVHNDIFEAEENEGVVTISTRKLGAVVACFSAPASQKFTDIVIEILKRRHQSDVVKNEQPTAEEKKTDVPWDEEVAAIERKPTKKQTKRQYKRMKEEPKKCDEQ